MRFENIVILWLIVRWMCQGRAITRAAPWPYAQMLNECARVTLYNILQSAAISVGVGGDMRLLRSNENWCFRRLRLIRPSSSLEDGNLTFSLTSVLRFRIIRLAIIAIHCLRKNLIECEHCSLCRFSLDNC